MQQTPRKLSADTRPRLSANAGRWLRTYGTFLGFLAIFAIFALLRPAVFLSLNNLRNITEQVAILAIVSTTMTVVMVVGDFDLSVGTLASLCGVVVGGPADPGPWRLARRGRCAAGGRRRRALNGLLVAYLGLSAFVATLATMTAYRGLALLVHRRRHAFFRHPGELSSSSARASPGPSPTRC